MAYYGEIGVTVLMRELSTISGQEVKNRREGDGEKRMSSNILQHQNIEVLRRRK